MTIPQISNRLRLTVEPLEARIAPSVTIVSQDTFDAASYLSANWQQWSNNGSKAFSTSAAKAYSGKESLVSTGLSTTTARVWESGNVAANDGVQATVYTDSLIPIQLFARGQNLNSDKPTYYAVTVTRGVGLEIDRVVNGVSTTLATIHSNEYVSGKWVQVRLEFNGNSISVEAIRTDTGQYLDSSGNWSATESFALTVQDSKITASGSVGISRNAKYAGSVYLDDFAVIQTHGAVLQENFNSTQTGGIPTGWASYESSKSGGFKASKSIADSGQGLDSTGSSTESDRAWVVNNSSKDVEVKASVYLSSLIPAQIFVRGSNLSSSTPTYYAVSVTEGTTVEIDKVVAGHSTTLATLSTNDWLVNKWVRVSITIVADHLQVRVERLDTGEWLNADGNWQSTEVAALDAWDGTITAAGQSGLSRPASYNGTIGFDDFEIDTPANITPPTVKIQLPQQNTNLSGSVNVSVSAQDTSGIARLEFYVDGYLVAVGDATTKNWTIETRDYTNGIHTLKVIAFDADGNSRSVVERVSISNPTSSTSVTHHSSTIGVAVVDYASNTPSSTDTKVLQKTVDVAVTDSSSSTKVASASSSTSQFIYSNLSNIYSSSLTDWLNYAQAHGISEETAFYHVSQATAFSGNSPSSQPVNYFWNVESGSSSANMQNLTSQSQNQTYGDVSFGGSGNSLSIGYDEKYREINFNLASGKKSGWSYVVEYATAVDASGNPTQWKTLTLNSDSTHGLSQSGQFTFDPPSDWVAATMSGSTARLYYVRIRAVSGTATAAPVATTILGRDYVNARGGDSGTIPAFDYAADTDHDGYLNDAEYAKRAKGKDARFVYESRLFDPYYGQERYLLNPSSSSVQEWAARYASELLNANPQAKGLFVDNSNGEYPATTTKTIESTDTYSADYVALLGTVKRSIAPKWIMANISGAGTDTTRVVQVAQMVFDESGLRAMATNWVQFAETAKTISGYLQASSTSSIVLDAYSVGGSSTDTRTEIATLAEYYLLADSQRTYLSLWGGEEPAATISSHYFNAVSYNLGQAEGSYSTFATGTDPSNHALTYQIYERKYSNGLVLYKPLSYAAGYGTGTTNNGSATTQQLGGRYRELNADGSLGPVITQITLRNGEGAILVKA